MFQVNINPAYQIAELEYCLRKAKVKALIVPDKFKTQHYPEMVREIAPELTSCKPGNLKSSRLPHLKSLVVISDEEFPGAITYERLIQSSSDGDRSKIYDLQENIDPDTGCNMQFTPGTTGQPKAALLSHHNVVNNAYFSGKRLEFDKKHHRICLPLPMFHGFANVLGIITALHFGSTIVLPSYTFTAEESIRAIENESCTAVFGTPTMFVDILSKSSGREKSFSSLEFAIMGGSPVAPQLFKQVTHMFSLKKCYIAYGMTETSPLTFSPFPQDSLEHCSTTVGKVMDHTEVKIVDKEGNIVPMGRPGELLVRGYCNMLCYYGDEEKTKEMIGPDRWLRTGDQFILHEDGYGQVVGRLKDMIIRGGENIFPKEIEDFIVTHPAILDAQVVGIPDERFGEEICACIRLNEHHELTAQQLKEFCKGKIAHFKIPRYIEFLSDYPRTQSGKVQKHKLREIVMPAALNS